MDVKIVNYIDPEKQLAQKQAVEDAKRDKALNEFKDVLANAVNETTARAEAKKASSFSNTVPTVTTTNASSVNEALGCPDQLDAYFEEAADKYNVDVNLLKSIAKQESAYTSDSVSSSGAVGIMQLMPTTAAYLGVTDAYDPYQNIMGGAKYISEMLSKYNGDISLALAAYNAGPGAVDKYNGIPPYEETQDYVVKVTNYYAMAQTAEKTENARIATNANQGVASPSSYSASNKVLTRAQLYSSIEQMLDLMKQSIELLQEEEENNPDSVNSVNNDASVDAVNSVVSESLDEIF